MIFASYHITKDGRIPGISAPNPIKAASIAKVYVNDKVYFFLTHYADVIASYECVFNYNPCKVTEGVLRIAEETPFGKLSRTDRDTISAFKKHLEHLGYSITSEVVTNQNNIQIFHD